MEMSDMEHDKPIQVVAVTGGKGGVGKTNVCVNLGIALSQLVRKGAPVVYGTFLTTMNLKTGAPTFGTPEANLSTFAIAQLCRRIGLPLRCGGHLTASKVADGQAMQESAASMMAGILAV